MSSPPPDQKLPGLIDHLYQLAAEEDRAAFAALRRGLGKPPGAVAEMARHVVRYLPDHTVLDADFYLIASLFGLHPRPWDGPAESSSANLGASLRRLAPIATDAGAKGVERRFVALLNADRDDLPTHLRHAVALLAFHDEPIEWALLLRHLRHWDHPERWVQRRWARSFWAASRDPAETKADAASGADPADDPQTDT